MNRFFCVMEEAGTYRKGFRNNEKLNSVITEGTMTVEIKYVNSFTMNDNRAFALCTNSRDAVKIKPGARRFLCLEGSDVFSQKAVDEKRCALETRRAYMTKLDRRLPTSSSVTACAWICPTSTSMSHFGCVPSTSSGATMSVL